MPRRSWMLRSDTSREAGTLKVLKTPFLGFPATNLARHVASLELDLGLDSVVSRCQSPRIVCLESKQKRLRFGYKVMQISDEIPTCWQSTKCESSSLGCNLRGAPRARLICHSFVWLLCIWIVFSFVPVQQLANFKYYDIA